MAPKITGSASISVGPLLPTVAIPHDIAVGVSISAAPALPAVTTSPEVAGASTTTAVRTTPAPPPKIAESAFLEKNSSIRSLVVLSIHIMDDNGAALIDLDVDPWTSLPSSTRPQREDLAEEILRRYVSENLSDRPDMKREPKPKQWDKKKMLKWLDDNPVTDTNDVQFLMDTVRVRQAATKRIAEAKAEAKEFEDKSGGAWYGLLPMLCLIMALVDSDEIRQAYITRNDISNERIVLDNQSGQYGRVVRWTFGVLEVPG